MLATVAKRKLLSRAIAKGVVNQIINSRLNYVAQIHEIPQQSKDKINKEIQNLVRAQFGLDQPTILARMYTEQQWGGLGIEDPANVADRAMLAEYMMAINSGKEAYTAEIMQENASHSTEMARTDQAQHRKTKAQMHTPTSRTWQQAGHECSCGANSSRDTMHAQALRCAGLSISESSAHRCTLSEQARERERRNENYGKHQLQVGEIIWVQHKLTGDQRLAAFYGINTQNIGQDKMALAWLPSFESAKRGRAPSILCRQTDAHMFP